MRRIIKMGVGGRVWDNLFPFVSTYFHLFLCLARPLAPNPPFDFTILQFYGFTGKGLEARGWGNNLFQLVSRYFNVFQRGTNYVPTVNLSSIMEKKKRFIKRPRYPGGPKAMRAFIQQNLRYPPQAWENDIEGTVHIRFTIDHKGEVIATKIISGLGYGCDEEAIRLVKLLRFEVPKNRKLRVVFHKTLHIHFRKPTRTPTSLTYTYLPAQKKDADETSSSGYHYTIDF